MLPSPELPVIDLYQAERVKLLIGLTIEIVRPEGLNTLGLCVAGGIACHVRDRLEEVCVFTNPEPDGDKLRQFTTVKFAHPGHVFLVPIVQEEA